METVRVSGLTHPHPFLEVPLELFDAYGRLIRLTQWNPQARVGADVQVSLQGAIDPVGGMPNLSHPLDCGDGRVITVQAGGVHYKPDGLSGGMGTYVLSVTGWLEVPAVWLLRENGEPGEPDIPVVEATESAATQEAGPSAEAPLPDVDITSHDTPTGYRAYMRRDGTMYLKEVEG